MVEVTHKLAYVGFIGIEGGGLVVIAPTNESTPAKDFMPMIGRQFKDFLQSESAKRPMKAFTDALDTHIRFKDLQKVSDDMTPEIMSAVLYRHGFMIRNLKIEEDPRIIGTVTISGARINKGNRQFAMAGTPKAALVELAGAFEWVPKVH